MDNITKALYSNHINIIRNESEEIQEYDVINEQDITELIEFLKHYKPDVNEAEYQGRKVKLGKPTRGDVKKFKVYVKNPKGNVVKVNFGHKGKGGEKTMRIKSQTLQEENHSEQDTTVIILVQDIRLDIGVVELGNKGYIIKLK